MHIPQIKYNDLKTMIGDEDIFFSTFVTHDHDYF